MKLSMQQSSTLPTMALLATVFRTSFAAHDFPMMPDILLSICGTTSLEFTPQNACNFKVMSIGFAFLECVAAHKHDNLENFKNCLSSCASNQDCPTACAGTANPPDCEDKCARLVQCTGYASTRAAGQVSTERYLRSCIMQESGVDSVYSLEPDGGAIESEGSTSTLGLFQNGDARGSHHKQHLVTRGVPLPLGSDRKLGLAEAASTAAQYPLVYDPSCACDNTGYINGVQTNRPGCMSDTLEPEAGTERYCYVPGGLKCGGAMTSYRFAGLAWTSCETIDMKKIFLPQCELYDYKPANLTLQWSFTTQEKLRPPPSAAALKPAEEAGKVVPFSSAYVTWKEDLPNSWHAQSNYAFGYAAPSPAGGAPASVSPLAPASLVEERKSSTSFRGNALSTGRRIRHII